MFLLNYFVLIHSNFGLTSIGNHVYDIVALAVYEVSSFSCFFSYSHISVVDYLLYVCMSVCNQLLQKQHRGV